MAFNDFVVSFMFIITGVILLTAIADEVTGVTQANNINNESVTLAINQTTSLANSQLDSFTSLVNATNATDVFVLNTDYTVDTSAGSITSLTKTGGANATYVYREVGDATARSLTNLIVIFFTIGVFMAGVGFGVKGLREAGVL